MPVPGTYIQKKKKLDFLAKGKESRKDRSIKTARGDDESTNNGGGRGLFVTNPGCCQWTHDKVYQVLFTRLLVTKVDGLMGRPLLLPFLLYLVVWIRRDSTYCMFYRASGSYGQPVCVFSKYINFWRHFGLNSVLVYMTAPKIVVADHGQIWCRQFWKRKETIDVSCTARFFIH